MALKSKYSVAILSLALGLGIGCTDDEQKVEEPVQPEVTEEPAPEPEPEPVETFTPETVYFAFDDYTLKMDAQQKLNELADHLKQNQDAVVQVEGHCDERGSIEYNLALGERRAQSVKDYLVQLGIDSGRISTISYGEEKPAVEGHSEDAWSQNRRAEFTITQG